MPYKSISKGWREVRTLYELPAFLRGHGIEQLTLSELTDSRHQRKAVTTGIAECSATKSSRTMARCPTASTTCRNGARTWPRGRYGCVAATTDSVPRTRSRWWRNCRSVCTPAPGRGRAAARNDHLLTPLGRTRSRVRQPVRAEGGRRGRWRSPAAATSTCRPAGHAARPRRGARSRAAGVPVNADIEPTPHRNLGAEGGRHRRGRPDRAGSGTPRSVLADRGGTDPRPVEHPARPRNHPVSLPRVDGQGE